MTEAGYSAAKPVKVKVQTSASGSGQMQPLPMNEFVQQSAEGVLLRRAVRRGRVEHAVLQLAPRREGPGAHGAHAINVSFGDDGPVLRDGALREHQGVPAGVEQLGLLRQRRSSTSLIDKARTSFDDKQRDAALATLQARIVDEAPFVLVAHDVGPRAMSPKVKGVVQPQSWFIDLATMSMD